jgi:hypothetical protein
MVGGARGSEHESQQSSSANSNKVIMESPCVRCADCGGLKLKFVALDAGIFLMFLPLIFQPGGGGEGGAWPPLSYT